MYGLSSFLCNSPFQPSINASLVRWYSRRFLRTVVHLNDVSLIRFFFYSSYEIAHHRRARLYSTESLLVYTPVEIPITYIYAAIISPLTRLHRRRLNKRPVNAAASPRGDGRCGFLTRLIETEKEENGSTKPLRLPLDKRKASACTVTIHSFLATRICEIVMRFSKLCEHSSCASSCSELPRASTAFFRKGEDSRCTVLIITPVQLYLGYSISFNPIHYASD